MGIEKIVAGGYGLGHVDGRVVLVPYSTPGDEALIEVAPSRKGVSWGAVKRVLSPSPNRTSPFCVHYTQCGGCQLQHISYPAQLEYKRLIVDEALRRLAGLEAIDVRPCVGSPAQTGYRSRVRLHCHGREVGFHKSRSNTIVPVEGCPLLPEATNACLRQIASHLSRRPIKGLSEIQMTEDTDSRVILTLEISSLPGAGIIRNLREEVAVFGAVARVRHRRNLLWGEEHCRVSIEGRTFRVSPASFFQANLGLLPALVREVLGAAHADQVDTAVELYAGVGLFSIPLSERVRRLVAVEWNRDAVEDARANLVANRVENVEVLAMSAEDALDALLAEGVKPELVVMDPPREGLSDAVRDKLLQVSPRQIAYISCDPATLARDIKSLLVLGAYRLEKLTPLDMFPHTAHIECVCSLMRT